MTFTTDKTMPQEITKSELEKTVDKIVAYFSAKKWRIPVFIGVPIISAMLLNFDLASAFQRTFNAEEFTKYHCSRGTGESAKALNVKWYNLEDFCKNYFSVNPD